VAYTLKSSGLATDLLMCVAIDEDGTTVREFVSSDVNTNMTLTSVTTGSSTWKSVSRGYFVCTADGGAQYFGPKFASGHRPAINAAGITGVFIAFASHSVGNNTEAMSEWASGIIVARSSGGKFQMSTGGGAVGNTTLPTGGTKFSVGANHTAFVLNAFFYGAESGSLAADGSSVDPGFGTGSLDVAGIGGGAGQGNSPGSYHIFCYFDRALTEAEYQTLHDDWFGVLFDAPGGGGKPHHYFAQMRNQ
jgi:hypothetical protein